MIAARQAGEDRARWRRMHEMSLAQSIVDIVARAAESDRFTRVVRIRIAVGALSHVAPDALAFSFDAVSRGTVAEGAALDIERPPGAARCETCGGEFALAQRGDPCPGCGGYRVCVTAGDELRVTELEVD